MITPAVSKTMDCRKPYSRIEVATASSFLRGFWGWGFMDESFRSSISWERTLSTGVCAGGSELRSAAPAIQGGGQATRCGLPLAEFYINERITSRSVIIDGIYGRS